MIARSQKGSWARLGVLRTPALHAWHRELGAGERMATTFDALWLAACAEMNAVEHAQIPDLAAKFLEDARGIIRDEIKRQRGVA